MSNRLNYIPVLFLVLLLNSINNLTAQKVDEELVQSIIDSADVLLANGESDRALKILEKGLQLYDQDSAGKNTVLYTQLVGYKAFYFYNTYQIDSFYHYTIDVENMYDKLLYNGDTSKVIIEELNICYNDLAAAFYYLKQYKRALNYMNCVLLNSDMSIGNQVTANLLHNIGTIYVKIGDHKTGLDYLDQSVRLDTAAIPVLRFRTYLSQSAAYYGLGDFERSEAYKLLGTEEAIKNFGEDHVFTAEAYTTMGNMYFANQDPEGALVNLEKAKVIFEKSEVDNRTILGHLHFFIGLANSWSQNYEKAIAHLEKSIDFTDDSSLGQDNKLAERYLGLATAQMNAGALHEARESMSAARDNLVFEIPDDGIINHLESPILVRDYYRIYLRLLNLMKLKEEERSDVNLNNVYDEAILVEDYIIASMIEDDSKFAQADAAASFYEEYILYKMNLNEALATAETFYISEKNKQRQLREYLGRIHAPTRDEIPASYLAEKRNLKSQIVKIENQIYRSRAELNSDSLVNNVLRPQLFNANKKYVELNNMLRKKYPVYANYNDSRISIELIQDKLNADQSILEYFAGDSNLFVHLIRKDTLVLYHYENVKDIEKKILDYRELIFNYWVSEEQDLDEYNIRNKLLIRQSKELYDLLISGFEEELTEEVVIIPDGVISLLPFETLISDNTSCELEFPNCEFLIQKKQINYSYSLSLMEDLTRNAQASNYKKELAVFVPTYHPVNNEEMPLLVTRSELVPLKYTIKEAEGISKMIRADVFSGPEASKDNFIKKGPQYRILHLASHAKSNVKEGDFSFLAFDNTLSANDADFLLYANELSDIRLHADMVVLSACETGLGEHQKGEGIIGLARSIFYTGVPSVIVSLWSVNDTFTSDLMKSFYGFLKKGSSKSASLRMAKLSALDHKLYSDPYFWSSFVSYGDDSPMYAPSRKIYYLGFTAFLIVCGLTVRWYLNKKKSI